MQKEIVDFLMLNPNGWLATTAADGSPRTRPFLFLMEVGGKLFWGTDRHKDVYSQLKKTHLVEFGSVSQEMITLRVRGQISFTENREVKKAAFQKYDYLKNVYKSDDNPDWSVFFMEHGEALFRDFTGEKNIILKF